MFDSFYKVQVHACVATVAALAGEMTGICMGYLAIPGEDLASYFTVWLIGLIYNDKSCCVP